MAVVESNVISQGVSASWSQSSGYTVNANFIVKDTGVGDLLQTRALRVMEDPGIPTQGSALADPKYNALTLNGISSDLMDDPELFSVVCTFSRPSFIDLTPSEVTPESAVMSVEGSVVEVETMFDNNGVQLFTNHTDPKKTEDPNRKVPGSVRYFAPSTTINFSRREPVSPGIKSILYLGALNSVGVFGDGPRTWMCKHLGGPSDDGGKSWLVQYSFQRSPKMGKDPATGEGDPWTAIPWDPLLVEVDDQGNPVKDPVMGKGKKIVQVQRLKDFFDLHLTWDGPS